MIKENPSHPSEVATEDGMVGHDILWLSDVVVLPSMNDERNVEINDGVVVFKGTNVIFGEKDGRAVPRAASRRSFRERRIKVERRVSRSYGVHTSAAV